MGACAAVMMAQKIAAAGGSLAIVRAVRGTAVATSATITISPAAANLLVVCVSGYNGSTANHAMSDNIGGATGWVKVGGVAAASGDPTCVSMWYKQNIPAGITSLTCTGGTSTLITIGIAHEVSGASTSAAFTGGEVQTNAQTATTTPTSGTVNNGTANSIFFAALTNKDGTNPAKMDCTGTGFSVYDVNNSEYLNGASLFAVTVPSGIFSSSASRACTWSTNNFATATVIAAFH